MPPPRPPARETQRIAKLLARAGVASRREVERMIEDRRIAVGGQIVETPATLLESLHGVTVDGKPVAAPAPARLFRFHKPAGLLTAERDPAGRPTIYDRLDRGLPRLMPVGRLDMNTEGLLLLTTDGELKRSLELPATGVERSYRARCFGEISQERLETLIEGIEVEGVRYGPIDANLERRTGRNQWIELRLREGKNREVRRVLEHLGLQVSRLIRTAYGPFRLDDLAPGKVDEVRRHDLVQFRKSLRDGDEDALRAAPSAPMGSRPPRTRQAPGREAGNKPPSAAAPRAHRERPDRPKEDGARPRRPDRKRPEKEKESPSRRMTSSRSGPERGTAASGRGAASSGRGPATSRGGATSAGGRSERFTARDGGKPAASRNARPERSAERRIGKDGPDHRGARAERSARGADRESGRDRPETSGARAPRPKAGGRPGPRADGGSRSGPPNRTGRRPPRH